MHQRKLPGIAWLLVTFLLAGSLFAFAGVVYAFAPDTDLSNADASFIGEDEGDWSGWSVASAGDVNSDGYDDFLIGAFRDDDGGSAAGQTYLILGSAAADWGMDFDLSNADASFWGEDSGDYSGDSVACAGDINGDGYDDFLIGAPYNEDGGSMAGQTYLWLGTPPPPPLVHNLNTGENFSTIQAAIDAVNTTSGHTITVDAGTYNENVNVTKQLTIRSTSGNPADTIVNASNPDAHVFNVTANWVDITGFTVENATGTDKAGIYLNVTRHCNISSNDATGNKYGIYLNDSSNNTLTHNTANLSYHCGIRLDSSSNNTLINNAASNNNWNGIRLRSSSNNTLINNTANSNNDVGICLYSSSNSNTLSNNTAYNNNDYGIFLSHASDNTLTNNTANSNGGDGILLSNSSNNNLTDNTANSNNRDGIYLHRSSNNVLANNTASNNLAGIELWSLSNNNTLTNNTANSNNRAGIALWNSSNNNTLTNNTANSNNDYGIRLWSSSNNTLTNNTANSNNDYGIRLYSSSKNTVYNNYFNNTNNAWDNAANTWNSTKQAGTNIIGGPYLGGNYWSDYSGNDTNGDGFGDSPYNISGGANKDYLPLIVTPAPTLTVNVIPAGKGAVKANGVTLTGYPNTSTWTWHDVVTLEAVDSTDGWGFVNWSGDLSGNATPANITMDSDKSVLANFKQPETGCSPSNLTFSAWYGETPAEQTLDIWNSGGGTLNWSVSDDAPWLRESPTSGSLGVGQHDYITVSVNTSGMNAGLYSANITITGSANVTIPVTLEIKVAIDVIRNLAGRAEMPNETYPGDTFDVYVNFTAPVDDFNAIGLTDLAPDGWEVAVDKAWCTPNADQVKATGNKAEIGWFGPAAKNDNFSAMYKVTVPETAELGISEFPLDDCSKAWLEYYFGELGPYTSCVIGEHEMTVTTTIDVIRDLPADAMDFDAEYPGDSFWVYVNFTAPVNDFNSIGMTDFAPAGWEVETNVTWCTPNATWTMSPFNKAEYAWAGPFNMLDTFTAKYKVTIPATANPGSSYWPDCTPLPCPPCEGSPINNYPVWVEYWFGADGPYESCITGDYEKIVTVPGCVVGETRDVNGDLLDTVLVTLYETPAVWEDDDSSSIVGSEAVYKVCADDTGMYYLVASKYCYFSINTRPTGDGGDMPPSRNPAYPDYIDFSTPELLAAGNVTDFVGDYGLVCKAASLSMAMEAVNHMLFTPEEPLGTPHPDWKLSNWKVSQVVHAWQFPCGCNA